MYNARDYLKAQSCRDAGEALSKSKRNKIVAGNMWLRLSRGSYNSLIDITDLGLDYIKEKNGSVKIGACTPLRKVELSNILAENYGGVFAELLSKIVGVQFRNTATIGGNVFLKHGFSDIITLLSVLNARVCFELAGEMALSEYLGRQMKKDLLKEIIIPAKQKVSFAAYKPTATDLSALNAAVCRSNSEIRVAVGARPAVAKTKVFAADTSAEKIAASFSYGSNMRASAAYRKIIAVDLLEKCLADLQIKK